MTDLPPEPAAPQAPAGTTGALPTTTATLPPPSGDPAPAPLVPLAPSSAARHEYAVPALVCGLLGFIPLVGIAGVVLGILTLRGLRSGPGRGKGMAVTGIVAGTVLTLLLAVPVTIGIVQGIQEEADKPPTRSASTGRVPIDDLVRGDCVDGVTGGSVFTLPKRPCTSSHQGQVFAVSTLPEGAFPGTEVAQAKAEGACTRALDTQVAAAHRQDVDVLYFYPDSKGSWEASRRVVCIASRIDGKPMTTSVLR